jgi:hypothetical protein
MNLYSSFNEHDLSNLRFLQSLRTDTQWRAWAEVVSLDDLEYALELLQRAKNELVVRELELADDVTDLSDAQRIISIFQRN